MKRILFILCVLFACLHPFMGWGQTFTPIHNYQAPDGLAVIKYLGIPYGPTPALNVTRNNAGPLFFNTTDSSLYAYTGTQWIKVGGGTFGSCPDCYDSARAINDTTLTLYRVNGDSTQIPFTIVPPDLTNYIQQGDTYLDPLWGKIDSNHTYKSSIWDSVYQYRNGDSSMYALIYAPDGFIVTPQITWSGAGLTVDGTYGIYRIDNEIYNSPQGSVTFATADPGNGRYDVVAVDTTGALVVVQGTAAANPSIPQVDDGSQLAVAIYYIAAGATTPTGSSEEPVFNENTVPEWIPVTASGPTINANQTLNVFSGTKTLDVGAFTNGNSVTFTKTSGTVTASDYTTLKMRVRLKSNLANKTNISVTLLNGTTVITPAQIPLTSNGLVKNVTGSYQNVSIRLDNLALTQNTFNKIKLNLSGSNASGFYVDYVVLQAGNVQVSANNYVTNIYRKTGTDSVFKVINGASTFAFIDSTGAGGSTDTTSLSDRIDLKQNLITLTTTGSSGAATFNQGTGALNIPEYAGGGGGITALGPIGAAPNANAGTIAGSTLNFEPASTAFGGVVTTARQSFRGVKRFTDSLTVDSTLYIGNFHYGTYIDPTPDNQKTLLTAWDTSRYVAADGAKTFVGGGFYPSISKTSGNAADGIGIGLASEFFVWEYNTSDWTSPDGIQGIRASTVTWTGATGTITNASSIYASADLRAMTITNHRKLWLDNAYVSGTAAVTNNYGLYISAQNAGSSLNYGIYQAGTTDSNYLGGATRFLVAPYISSIPVSSVLYTSIGGTGSRVAGNSSLLSFNGLKLGIGIASATADLEINKTTAGANAIYLINPSTSNLAYSSILMGEATTGNKFLTLEHYNNSLTGGSGMTGANVSALAGWSSGGLNIGAVGAAGILRLFSGGTGTGNERVRIQADGKVGFHTTAPLYPVDISSSLLQIGADNGLTTRTNATFKTVKMMMPSYLAASAPIVMMTTGTDGTESWISFGGGTSTGNAATYVDFWTAANATTLTGTQRMKITSTGNVGIGEGTPTAVLHIKAGTAAANTAPLKFTSGTNLTTAVAGAMEYNGTNFFLTPSSAARNNILMTASVNSVSPTAPDRTITVVIDGTTYYISAKTTND